MNDIFEQARADAHKHTIEYGTVKFPLTHVGDGLFTFAKSTSPFPISAQGHFFIMYRLENIDSDNIDEAYQTSDWDAYAELVNQARKAQKQSHKESNRYVLKETLVSVLVDGVLVSLLTKYNSVPDTLLLDAIADAGLDENVYKATVTPKKTTIFLRSTYAPDGVAMWGMGVYNGATGLTALYSSVSVSVKGMGVFNVRPTGGYARHMGNVPELRDKIIANFSEIGYEEMRMILFDRTMADVIPILYELDLYGKSSDRGELWGKLMEMGITPTLTASEAISLIAQYADQHGYKVAAKTAVNVILNPEGYK